MATVLGELAAVQELGMGLKNFYRAVKHIRKAPREARSAARQAHCQHYILKSIYNEIETNFTISEDDPRRIIIQQIIEDATRTFYKLAKMLGPLITKVYKCNTVELLKMPVVEIAKVFRGFSRKSISCIKWAFSPYTAQSLIYSIRDCTQDLDQLRKLLTRLAPLSITFCYVSNQILTL